MASRAHSLVAAWTALREHPAFRRSPLRLLARVVVWAAHCAVRRPATIELGGRGARLKLPPRFQRGGTTGVFVLREDYEPELAYVGQTLRDGMVFVDGGANLGIYTVLASRLVGDSGVVLSFEPGETSFRSLEENIALNGARNVRPYRKALSDTTGSARLYHTRGGLVGYSLTSDEGPGIAFEEIGTTTIDDVLAAQGIERLDFIKLDVEGAEELALRGARGALERARPRVLFELQPYAPIGSGLRHDGAWTLLQELGYRLCVLAPDGTLEPRDAPQVGNNIALPD